MFVCLFVCCRLWLCADNKSPYKYFKSIHNNFRVNELVVLWRAGFDSCNPPPPPAACCVDLTQNLFLDLKPLRLRGEGNSSSIVLKAGRISRFVVARPANLSDALALDEEVLAIAIAIYPSPYFRDLPLNTICHHWRNYMTEAPLPPGTRKKN